MREPFPDIDDLLAESQTIGQASPRLLWAINRFWMESQNLKTRRYGHRSHHHWYLLRLALRTFDLLLRGTGLHARGRRNALEVALNEYTIPLPTLPTAFDGLSVLHLSDLHLDMMPGLEDRILSRIGNRSFDLCLLTGDYRGEVHGPTRPCLEAIRRLVPCLRSRLGVYGVLGNHDDVHMVRPLENAGLRLLINESVLLERGGQSIRLLGTDDVHYYHTDQATQALQEAADGFALAMVHSPEFYSQAAEAAVDLYLCGHTHAGQVCLPGGRAIITHLHRGKRYMSGLWRYRSMTGFTNAGAGCSGLPVRFFTRPEIAVLKLQAAES